MANASKPRRKISFQPLAASVRRNYNGEGAFFDVTFKCVLSSGTGIRLGHHEVLLLMQLAEASYGEILGLLAGNPNTKKPKKRAA